MECASLLLGSIYLGRASRSRGAGRTSRTLTGSRTAKVLRSVRTRTTMARHSHVVRRRRSRAVGGTNSGVVLRAAPAQADARVSDGVALHLVDGHLGSVAVDKLHKAAALARRNLNVGDFTESLEKGAELVLGDVAGEATDKDGRVVRVGELVHLSGRVVAAVGKATLHAVPHGLLRHAAAHHGAGMVAVSETVVTAAQVSIDITRAFFIRGLPVFRGSSRDAHGSVATVDTLHLDEGALLVILVGEAHKAVSTALARHGIRHDLSRLAGGEAGLEERD